MLALAADPGFQFVGYEIVPQLIWVCSVGTDIRIVFHVDQAFTVVIAGSKPVCAGFLASTPDTIDVNSCQPSRVSHPSRKIEILDAMPVAPVLQGRYCKTAAHDLVVRAVEVLEYLSSLQ